MTFSIIIPVYNVESYLSRCLDSVLAQTVSDYEIILVDDGSTDGSGKICEAYRQQHPEIKLIHQENGGLSAARNAGLAQAGGDWLVFVDSDDWIAPHMLEALQRRIAEEDPDVISINACMMETTEKALFPEAMFATRKETLDLRLETRRFLFLLEYLLPYKVGWEVCFNVFKRQIVEENHLHFTDKKEIFAEDLLFTFQYLLHAQTITIVEDVLYFYYQRPDSIIHTTVPSSVLPRLLRLGELAFADVKAADLPMTAKYFYELYFVLLDHHIQGLLHTLPTQELQDFLYAPQRSAQHKKWLKQMARHLPKRPYAGARSWLKNGRGNAHYAALLSKRKKEAGQKKMLVLNDMLSGGGVEKLMYDLVTHWSQAYDITILTSSYYAPSEKIYPWNVRCPVAPMPISVKEGSSPHMARGLSYIQKFIHRFWLRLYAKCHSYDLLLAIKDGYAIRDGMRFRADKKLAWVHTDYNNYYYTKPIFGSEEAERACMAGYQNVVCVSQTIADGIVHVIGDPGNLVVRYNPLDVRNVLLSSKVSLDENAPVREEGVVRFVSVGRLNYQKGFPLLLEACHMLEQDGLPFEVWIVGGEEPWGDEHTRLYTRQRQLHLKSVHFLGAKSNPYPYMKAADWFISSSLFEGYSLVSQEAALLDIPMILTDCSGVREFLGDSEYGIVAEISVLSLYENMKRVIEDCSLHEHYQKQIQKRKGMISFQARMRKIEELFAEK